MTFPRLTAAAVLLLAVLAGVVPAQPAAPAKADPPPRVTCRELAAMLMQTPDAPVTGWVKGSDADLHHWTRSTLPDGGGAGMRYSHLTYTWRGVAVVLTPYTVPAK